MSTKEVAKCRGCNRVLDGDPNGWQVFIPEPRERARTNYYGGWVCSETCDRKVSFGMESGFPGAGVAKRLSQGAANSLKSNWD